MKQEQTEQTQPQSENKGCMQIDEDKGCLRLDNKGCMGVSFKIWFFIFIAIVFLRLVCFKKGFTDYNDRRKPCNCEYEDG